MTVAVGVCFFELLQILIRDVSDLLDIEKEADSEFQFNLGLVIFEHLFSDGGNIQVMSGDSLDQQLVMFFGPIEAFLGVEVSVI